MHLSTQVIGKGKWFLSAYPWTKQRDTQLLWNESHGHSQWNQAHSLWYTKFAVSILVWLNARDLTLARVETILSEKTGLPKEDFIPYRQYITSTVRVGQKGDFKSRKRYKSWVASMQHAFRRHFHVVLMLAPFAVLSRQRLSFSSALMCFTRASFIWLPKGRWRDVKKSGILSR